MARLFAIVVESLNGSSVKSVTVTIDGVETGEYYSYPTTVSDAVIETEVNADLDAKGYVA